MPTKICKVCGWVLDIRDPRHTCPICHTYLTDGLCKECRRPSDDIVSTSGLCRSCYNERQRVYVNKQYHKDTAKLDALYTDWLAKVKNLPFKPLTEEQWLETCAHFNGCALCGSEHIDARVYFVEFKEGGQYAVWNIIPACDKCATKLKLQPNPFRRLSNLLNPNNTVLKKKEGINWNKQIAGIVAYLQSKIPKE